MRLPFGILIDPSSFLLGLAVATVFWWVVARARPLWKEIRANLGRRQEEVQARRMSSVEEDHRRITLRRAQGMHLAAPLFSLDEVLQEPRLLAPTPRVEPGSTAGAEDAVTLTLPYTPAWPELAGVYGAPTLSVEEALSGGRNLVIIGQPGAGKTVALAHLASLAANRSETLGALKRSVPFLLHVADLRLPLKDERELVNRIIDLASDQASVLNLGRVAGFVQAAFRSGRALLLLDGFDELTSEGQEAASGALRALLKEYPQTRIVTTGAPEYLDGLMGLDFAALAVAAWNRYQGSAFIRQWGRLWSDFVDIESWAQNRLETADPLLLDNWLSLDNETLTPLELSLKVWAAYAGDAPGPNVLEAIGAHIRRLAPANTPLAALETLAMQVMLTAQPVFDPRKARAWVKEFELPEELARLDTDSTAEATAVPEESEELTRPKRGGRRAPSPTPGLLGRLGGSGLLMAFPNNRMRFVHPVLGGYLAGRALSGYKAENTLLNQPDWIGKILAMRYLASLGDVSSLSQRMLEWTRLPMHRPLLTAARWLRDAPRGAPWRSGLMSALAELLQAEDLPLALRAQAVAALVSSQDPGVMSLFRKLLGTLSFDLMSLAALGCGALRDTKAVKALAETLQVPSDSARRAACLGLIAIGTTEALETVAHALLNGDEQLRRAAAESLANDPNEGYAMLRDGVTMQDILLRRAVVYGLGRVREAWAVELLEHVRVEDDQWVVRNSASEMLETRGTKDDPRVPKPLTPPSETPWVIAYAGTLGVGVSPGAPATDLLLKAFKNGKQEERLAALEYLKRTPSDGVVKEFYVAMFGDEPELREASYLALWEIGASGYKLPNPVQFGFN
jgi:HEAT repeat protein